MRVRSTDGIVGASGGWNVRRRELIVAAGVLLSLVATACGTRLGDDEFVQAGSAVGTEQTGPRADGPGAVGEITVGPDGSGPAGTGADRSGSVPDGTGGSGAAGGGADGGDAGPSGGSGGGSDGGSGAANFASDVGVTADTITIGNITDRTGPLGPEVFTPTYEGAFTYFQKLNADGGVNGRKIQFVTCDDAGNPDRNRACARELIEEHEVFAFTATSTATFAGAPLLSEAGVPDVTSIPISNAYYTYPELYATYSAEGYPRDGTQVGVDGQLYNNTAQFEWFKEELGVERAAVLFYSIPISKTAGEFLVEGLERAGIEVVYTPNGGQGRNPANPNWDTDVVNMRQQGAQALWHAIDIAGFQKLCQSMDRLDFRVRAAVATVQGAGQGVEDFSSPCRESVYASVFSVPYGNTDHPRIAEIHRALDRYLPDADLHQWVVEGWAGAELLVKGIESMGAEVTREGLMEWLDAQDGSETLGGLMAPGQFYWNPNDRPWETRAEVCFSVMQWDEAAGSFVSRVDDTFHCRRPAEYFPYTPVDDGSTG